MYMVDGCMYVENCRLFQFKWFYAFYLPPPHPHLRHTTANQPANGPVDYNSKKMMENKTKTDTKREIVKKIIVVQVKN